MAGTAAGVLVRSAFDLPAAQQEAIEAVIRESLDADISVRFATEPELISGIELITHGHKVAWSIAEYLASLGKGVDALLKAQPKPEVKTGQNANEHGV